MLARSRPILIIAIVVVCCACWNSPVRSDETPLPVVDVNDEMVVENNEPGPTRPFPPLVDPQTLEMNEESAQSLQIEEGPFPLLRTPVDPPLGFTGPSSIRPEFIEENSHFIPLEDRWRIGFPSWDRYGQGHPIVTDYPYMLGNIWDPFNQNVLKADYPIIGQNTFLNIAVANIQNFEGRQVPTPTTPFESTVRPGEQDFFQNPDQFFYTNFFRVQVDVFHGDTSFKPLDWQIRIAPVFNVNHLATNELAVVNPDVLDGSTRTQTWLSLNEWFIETKLLDLSPDYDFLSLRGGSQFFNSDFRGFIFADTNRSVRLFGNLRANRHQYNLIFFDQTDKDINNGLNTFRDRHQNTIIANYYIQDFIWPGYTSQWSIHYNNDMPSFKYDRDDILARPDPVGVYGPHRVESVYFGWTGNGHIDRFNITHAFYEVIGHDTLNPLAGRPVDINAQMGALELSYDRDWVRFRASGFYASGDGNINNGQATGFDTIFDNPNFAGGQFSYWQRQAIRLGGVNLVQSNSLVPDLRSSKFMGQTNFVNPGLWLVNVGMDFELTPKFRIIQNNNFLWFDKTAVLEQYLFQSNISRQIGYDVSVGAEYRPLLSNNIIVTAGVGGLIPGPGFKDIYSPIVGSVNTLAMGFMQLALAY
jgi:hypothetical protein